MNTKVKKTTKVVVNVLLWIFLALAIAMTIIAFSAQASGKEYPVFGNKCYLSVKSTSMAKEGGFYKGDLIVCEVLSDEEKLTLQEGDVIAFYFDKDLFDGVDSKDLDTHRIIEVDTTTFPGQVYYRTQGDNEEHDDGLIHSSFVEAKWTKTRIPVIGSVIMFLQSSVGFLVCIVVPLLAFFVYELVILIKTISNLKAKDKKLITKEEEELIKQRAIEEYLAQQNKEKEINEQK